VLRLNNDEELVRAYAKANEVKYPLPDWMVKKLLRETLPKGSYVTYRDIYHDGIITKRKCNK